VKLILTKFKVPYVLQLISNCETLEMADNFSPGSKSHTQNYLELNSSFLLVGIKILQASYHVA